MIKRILVIAVALTAVAVMIFLFVRQTQERRAGGLDQQFTHDEVEELPRFLESLPHESENFRISFLEGKNRLLIVPLIPYDPTISPFDMLEQHWSLYEQYGQEALGWIREQGVEPSDFEIEWWARDWWPEGKNITY